MRPKKIESEDLTDGELLQPYAEAVNRFAALIKPPKVAIFWYHNKKVLGDFFDFTSAEIYGNVVGPRSNHYDFWKQIQAVNPELACEEYEHTPRGRLLYDLIDKAFVIISSAAIIANKTALKAICRQCNIPKECLVTLKTDLHYESPCDLDWED